MTDRRWLWIVCALALAPSAAEARPRKPKPHGAAPASPATRPPAAAPAAAPGSPTAASVVASVEAYYRTFSEAKIAFTQTVTNVTFGTTKTVAGTLYLKKPGRMRWIYQGKPQAGKPTTSREFISDGKLLYLIDHDNQELVEKELATSVLPTVITFLDGQGDLAAEFTPSLVPPKPDPAGAPADLVLRLVPKVPSATYRSLELVVDRADHHVEASTVIDAADNSTRFDFGAADLSGKRDDGFFTVDPTSPALARYRLIEP
ncbi:MAG TPA: outer membrane lipoprotein carrier protein LolA [Kofleriaceae bacterium]|nr:outer membrane lipoprotein carrier protein LolA [Kofleriaceae bacterium]